MSIWREIKMKSDDYDDFKIRANFLNSVLFNSSPSPLSGQESEVLQRSNLLREIDDEIENGLMNLLSRLNGLVKRVDAVMFLLDVAEHSDEIGLELAIETLVGAADDRIVLSIGQLAEVFEGCTNSVGAPILLLNMIGDVADDTAAKIPPRNGEFDLNFEAMRNFK